MEKKLGISLTKEACPICTAEEDGPIVMNTVLSEKKAKEVENMHGKVIGYMKEPCARCQELMSKGFLLVGVIEEKSDDPKNPWRSGHQWVITNEKAAEMFDDEMLPQGAAFIDIKVAEKLGLPVMDLTSKGDA